MSHYRALAMNVGDLASRRARLAELEAALVRLRAQYDVLMNRFRFEEAREIAAHIETAERERAIAAASLPPPAEPAAAIRHRPPVRPRRRR
jgi:hypothetical protein